MEMERGGGGEEKMEMEFSLEWKVERESWRARSWRDELEVGDRCNRMLSRYRVWFYAVDLARYGWAGFSGFRLVLRDRVYFVSQMIVVLFFFLIKENRIYLCELKRWVCERRVLARVVARDCGIRDVFTCLSVFWICFHFEWIWECTENIVLNPINFFFFTNPIDLKET